MSTGKVDRIATDAKDRSYRALLGVPGLPQAVVAMVLGRVGESMVPVALVLTALTVYDSAPLAGLLTFLTVVPGLVSAPLIGALIDRYGRVRLIRIDYVVGASVTLLIAALILTSRLEAGLLLALTFVLGITQMFSDAGTRSLFADMVPDHLWERVNAADSVGYQLAWIAGPPIAAVLFSIWGASIAFLGISIAFGIAAVAILGLREKARPQADSTDLLRSARSGLGYVWRNRTLRGMAASVSITNVCFGIVLILVPVLIVDEIAADEGFVGLAFAVAGTMGAVSAVIFGRMNTFGRERILIAVGCAGMALTAALLYPIDSAEPVVALVWILGTMVVFGVTNGIWDIGIFTLRQRRTDSAMVGRAFAISMALNQSGYPIGAAIGGFLAATSIGSAVAVAVVVACLGTFLAVTLLPRDATMAAA
jgi:MFS family permease